MSNIKLFAFMFAILFASSAQSGENECGAVVSHLGQPADAQAVCNTTCNTGINTAELMSYSSVRGLFPSHTQAANGSDSYCRCKSKVRCISSNINSFSVGDPAFPVRANPELPGDVCNERIASTSECYKNFAESCGGSGCLRTHICGTVASPGATVCGTIEINNNANTNLDFRFNESYQGQFVCSLEVKNLKNKEALTFDGNTLGGPGVAGQRSSAVKNLKFEIYDNVSNSVYGTRSYTEPQRNGDRAGWNFKLSKALSNQLKAPNRQPACRMALGPIAQQSTYTCGCPKAFVGYMKRYREASLLYTRDELAMPIVCELCEGGTFPSEVTKSLLLDPRATQYTSTMASCLQEAEDEVFGGGEFGSYSLGTKPAFTDPGEIKTALYEYEYTLQQATNKIEELKAVRDNYQSIRDGVPMPNIAMVVDALKAAYNIQARVESLQSMESYLASSGYSSSTGWAGDTSLNDDARNALITLRDEFRLPGDTNFSPNNYLRAKAKLQRDRLEREVLPALIAAVPIIQSLLSKNVFSGFTGVIDENRVNLWLRQHYFPDLPGIISDMNRAITRVEHFKEYLTCGTYATEIEPNFDKIVGTLNFVLTDWPNQDMTNTNVAQRQMQFRLDTERYRHYIKISERRELVDVSLALDAEMSGAINHTLANVALSLFPPAAFVRGAVAIRETLLTAARYVNLYGAKAINLGIKKLPINVSALKEVTTAHDIVRMEKILNGSALVVVGGGLVYGGFSELKATFQDCGFSSGSTYSNTACLQHVADLLTGFAVGNAANKWAVGRNLPKIPAAAAFGTGVRGSLQKWPDSMSLSHAQLTKFLGYNPTQLPRVIAAFNNTDGHARIEAITSAYGFNPFTVIRQWLQQNAKSDEAKNVVANILSHLSSREELNILEAELIFHLRSVSGFRVEYVSGDNSGALVALGKLEMGTTAINDGRTFWQIFKHEAGHVVDGRNASLVGYTTIRDPDYGGFHSEYFRELRSNIWATGDLVAADKVTLVSYGSALSGRLETLVSSACELVNSPNNTIYSQRTADLNRGLFSGYYPSNGGDTGLAANQVMKKYDVLESLTRNHDTLGDTYNVPPNFGSGTAQAIAAEVYSILHGVPAPRRSCNPSACGR